MDVKGEMLELKATVNGMTESFEYVCGSGYGGDEGGGDRGEACAAGKCVGCAWDSEGWCYLLIFRGDAHLSSDQGLTDNVDVMAQNVRLSLDIANH